MSTIPLNPGPKLPNRCFMKNINYNKISTKSQKSPDNTDGIPSVNRVKYPTVNTISKNQVIKSDGNLEYNKNIPVFYLDLSNIVKTTTNDTTPKKQVIKSDGNLEYNKNTPVFYLDLSNIVKTTTNDTTPKKQVIKSGGNLKYNNNHPHSNSYSTNDTATEKRVVICEEMNTIHYFEKPISIRNENNEKNNINQLIESTNKLNQLIKSADKYLEHLKTQP
jgi:hypothetical protein